MYRKIKHYIGSNLINLQGPKLNRKIIVFESDDWGTIRMPNIKVREYLCSKFPYNFNLKTYDYVDNLANAKDLENLFEILCKYKDFKGNHPVITANTIVANPDFEKIRESGFSEYFYEPFTETLNKYSTHTNTFKFWKEGITAGVFHPQLHGREHLNVSVWLEILKNGEQSSIEALNHNTWVMKSDKGERLDIAFNYKSREEFSFVEKYLRESAELFEAIFGYKSKSYIAPSYTWNYEIEKVLYSLGVNTIQSGLYQILPEYDIKNGNERRKKHYNGQRNSLGQVYLMRNSHFEPTLIKNVDLVSKCLGDIACAFMWGKPAVISVHRLNFIGNLYERNRKNTLSLLDELLKKIVFKYPDVEFLTSDKLGMEFLQR